MIFPGIMVVEESTLYDTEPLVSSPLNLFAASIGRKNRLGEIKPTSDTNMQIDAMLPNPQRFHVKHIWFTLRNPHGDLITLFGKDAALWRGLSFVFQLGLTQVMSGLLQDFAHPNVVFQKPREKSRRFKTWAARSADSADITIETGCFFLVVVMSPRPLPFVFVTVTLTGKRTRSAQ